MAEDPWGDPTPKVEPVRVVREDGSIVWVDRNTGDYLYTERPWSEFNDPRRQAAEKGNAAAREQAGQEREAERSVVRIQEIAGHTWGLNRHGQPIVDYGPVEQEAGATKTTRWTDPTSGAEYIVNSETGEIVKQLSGPLPGWVPGRGVPAPAGAGPQRAPRYPEEEELARLQVQKARQSLIPPQALVMQQHNETIDQVAAMLASGEMTPAQADEYMRLIQANTAAALRGTSPWQQEEAKRQTTQANRAAGASMLNQRVSSGSSMASSLLSGAQEGFSRILGGTGAPTNFNPLEMAKGYVTDLGGGSQVSDFVKALLMGSGSLPSGQPRVPGYPTTREEVLAMYPELGAA